MAFCHPLDTNVLTISQPLSDTIVEKLDLWMVDIDIRIRLTTTILEKAAESYNNIQNNLWCPNETFITVSDIVLIHRDEGLYVYV